jgi:hypothetical protein
MLRKLPAILTVIYLILVLLSAIPIFTGGDALSGIFAIVLTAPWPMLLGNLVSGDSITAGLLLVAVGAAINAVIIYYVSRWIVSRLAH